MKQLNRIPAYFTTLATITLLLSCTGTNDHDTTNAIEDSSEITVVDEVIVEKGIDDDQQFIDNSGADLQVVQEEKEEEVAYANHNSEERTAVVHELQMRRAAPQMEMQKMSMSMDMSSGAGGIGMNRCIAPEPMPSPQPTQQFNTEEYDHIEENGFRRVTNEPLSTFSIDVDGAAFSNTRRFLNNNQRPPVDAVRIEEFINYFNYDYPQPTGDHPFSITTEIDDCPWNENHKLVHVGLQGEDLDFSEAPASNIVFLLDVSGSMNSPDKLPLLKQSLIMLTNEMRDEDRVAIVVYAGAAGMVLPSTSATETETIERALNQLNAGGSTAGAAGIELAYKIAKENFIDEGNNRVILATDGDFNVGTSSQSELVRLIEEKREQDIFLTVLGFGTGNYSDSRMEQLSNSGNGNYAYIDNILEAKKVLVNEMSGTLFTIAKDVKLQVEFNPTQVSSYRLIGYENRLLNNEDFNDDTKDAGELGAGHTVTALYEIVPTGAEEDTLPTVDPLIYQTESKPASRSNDILTVKFRYKEPEGDTSILLSQSLTSRSDGGKDLDWATAMAGFAMLLRESDQVGDLSWDDVLDMARDSRGADKNGYRAEAIRMIEQAQILYR